MPLPALGVIAGAVVGIAFFFMQFVPPVERELRYLLNRLLPNALPGVVDLIDLRHKGIIEESTYLDQVRAAGLNTTQANRLWEASHMLLTSEAVLLLYWRQEITEDEYVTRMGVLGYKATEAEAFNRSRLFYPSPTDLVSWQAREVFEPDSIEKYGLDSEFDRIDLEPFFMAGMSEEQIRNFWRAHWTHPPLTTVFELLHRGLLTEEDVFEYYRLVEIPPYWRDLLTQISFRPYTRVDVKRMYQVGILDRTEVKRAYLDIGYDDEKAENMTDFTVASTQTKERDLTRTQIERAFEFGVLKHDEAVAMLNDLGYDDFEAGLILTLKLYALAQDELDDKVATIQTMFRRGLIEQAEAIAELDKLEISAVYRDKVVAGILRSKQKEFQLPSKSDLISFYTNEIIDEEQFQNYMNRLGFRDTEITFYVESLKL